MDVVTNNQGIPPETSVLMLPGDIMEITEFLEQRLKVSSDLWVTCKPMDCLSRQDWQEIVEAIVEDVRLTAGRPAFGVSESEISVLYHQPLSRFEQLIRTRLGFGPPQGD